MTVTAMSDGIIDDAVRQAKDAGVKIYDSTVQKVVQKGKDIVSGNSGNTGINGGGANPNGGGSDPMPGAASTSPGPTDMTKTIVIAGLGAILVYYGVQYMKHH